MKRSNKPTPSLESAIVIGYSVGLRYVLGVGSQAMSNVAGRFVGKELYLYFKDDIKDLSDVERVLGVRDMWKFVEIRGTSTCPLGHIILSSPFIGEHIIGLVPIRGNPQAPYLVVPPHLPSLLRDSGLQQP